MDLIQAILLGALQGITEWLPISSQGQSVAAMIALFGIAPAEALRYSIFLHIGTLIAATIYFRNELLELAKTAVQILRGEQKIKSENSRLLKFLAIAILATAITAVPAYLLLKQTFETAGAGFVLLLIGVLLIVTGVVQLLAKKIRTAEITNRNAFFTGLGQGFSVLPGISRSGTTTAVLLFEGFKPEEAFRLSFLLSVPSVFVAEILFGIVEPGAAALVFEPSAIVALAVAAVVGFLSIKALLGVARKINFAYFCLLFGAVYVVVGLL